MRSSSGGIPLVTTSARSRAIAWLLRYFFGWKLSQKEETLCSSVNLDLEGPCCAP